MRENRRVAAVPHSHEAFAELTADPHFEGLSVALERNQFDSLGTMIKVYLPTAVHTLQQQAEVVNALTDFAAKWELESVVHPHDVVVMNVPSGS